ncbi:hypothetical protein ABTL55_19145, partial [Acinetobacter baumannii]
LLNTILSVFVGGLLGIGTALMMELLNRRIRSPEDLTEVLEIPVLAVLNGKASNKQKHIDNNSALSLANQG